jgi:hypothetical protein
MWFFVARSRKATTVAAMQAINYILSFRRTRQT